MTDSISLVGRTNVGKSLLFNKLVQYKNSIVLNKHGVTRDVNEGKVLYEDRYVNIYDTAGITSEDKEFSKLSYDKTINAIKKSSLILFITSLEDGLTSMDKEICQYIRKNNKSVIHIINKCDKEKSQLKRYEFSELGFETSIVVSAKTNKGMLKLVKTIFENVKSSIYHETNPIKVSSVTSKPNNE